MEQQVSLFWTIALMWIVAMGAATAAGLDPANSYYTSDWQTSNLTLDNVPDQFNHSIRPGQHSGRQTEDRDTAVARDWHASYPDPNRLSYANERFFSEQWQSGLKSHDRWKETWDLLHSYPVIGMARADIVKLLGEPSQCPPERDYVKLGYYQFLEEYRNVEFYQLTSHGDGEFLPTIVYLELRYKNGRVSAFRIDEVRLQRKVIQELVLDRKKHR